MQELKSKIEAVLFCSPKGVSTEKLASLCQIGSKGHVAAVIRALKDDYEARGAGVQVVEEESLWKFKLNPDHAELVREAAKPELSQAALETLSYIAWKGKIMQSELAKVRTSLKDHLPELIKSGLIERKRQAQSYLIKPTKLFYTYFDLKEGERLELPADSSN